MKKVRRGQGSQFTAGFTPHAALLSAAAGSPMGIIVLVTYFLALLLEPLLLEVQGLQAVIFEGVDGGIGQAVSPRAPASARRPAGRAAAPDAAATQPSPWRIRAFLRGCWVGKSKRPWASPRAPASGQCPAGRAAAPAAAAAPPRTSHRSPPTPRGPSWTAPLSP